MKVSNATLCWLFFFFLWPVSFSAYFTLEQIQQLNWSCELMFLTWIFKTICTSKETMEYQYLLLSVLHRSKEKSKNLQNLTLPGMSNFYFPVALSGLFGGPLHHGCVLWWHRSWWKESQLADPDQEIWRDWQPREQNSWVFYLLWRAALYWGLI